MSSKVLQNSVAQPSTKRLTRQSSKVYVEPTPRGPLKRRAQNKNAENKIPPTSVNGSGDDDENESPSKKSKLEVDEAADGSGEEMDVQDTNEDDKPKQNDDQEMSAEDDSLLVASDLKRSKDEFLKRGMTLDTTVKSLQSRRSVRTQDQIPALLRIKTGEPLEKDDVSNKSVPRPRQVETARSTMLEYKQKMEGRVKSTYPQTTIYATLNASHAPQYQMNNKSPQTTKLRKQAKRKLSVTKQPSVPSSKGCMIWRLLKIVLALVTVALGVLAYQMLAHQPGADAGHPATPPANFEAHLSQLEAQFPRQLPELWRRSRIHLTKHLQTAHPKEPASLILTAGRKAEKTLHCLAQGLASALSSALNGSVLQIDGDSMAGQDSNQVKFDIDDKLRHAFEGDKPVAVINRFEELPPGSTIIFYRYCDHENAAYKRASLIFTVLLPLEAVGHDHDLKEVEEMVEDHLKDKFLSSDHPAAFDSMDTDKLSGLWSRISHLILPVAAEERIEQHGCVS
ncbi:torsin-1A-interacting protein 2 [Hypomesus transpacificus]|uniref:torsin-1A-interacting protein 2 n=1 Tax=Hypomesus transpacificus TaxID=137520 RepID=UPI001F08683F|nr:torsin-1A-interacting protein 2 [Hypomesus transpacificus]